MQVRVILLAKEIFVRKIFLLLLSFFPLCAQEDGPSDQLLVLFGSSGYVLYKVIDFANDHGFRYLKILNYQFNAFGHSISGSCKEPEAHKGRYFELKDESLFVSFLCFQTLPDDIYIVDVNQYRSILESSDANE